MNQGAFKVRELLKDGQSHCCRELEKISWSKHKRIEDAERIYGIKIKSTICVHGVRNGKDYHIEDWKPPVLARPATPEEIERMKQTSLLTYQ